MGFQTRFRWSKAPFSPLLKHSEDFLRKWDFLNKFSCCPFLIMPESPSTDQLELWKGPAPNNEKQEMLFPLSELGASDQCESSDKARFKKPRRQLDPEFARQRPLNILVADDNEINRKVLRIILRKLGYNCAEAANGEEALQNYAAGECDYIFMDLDMPEMDGIQAAQAIRALERGAESEKSKSAEIIAVTANVSDETRLRCRRAGMNGYLEKPITAVIIKSQLLRSWPRIKQRREKPTR